jgi:hypothetical protein
MDFAAMSIIGIGVVLMILLLFGVDKLSEE